ncbi:MAG: NUDIX hydrolase [Rhodopseudomonas sp.]|nr:NUDIX hydrolase [Rhodopseudomonas sp.]
MSDPTVFHVDRLDLSFAQKPWAFADERRAEIEAHFAELRRRKPALWNGRILLLHRQIVRDGVFSGQFLETDYASFVSWRHWGHPRAGVRDCFGVAAILSADGAFMLGVMADHTSRGGEIYFPCGTPDRSDIVGDVVDFDASVARELAEETGLRLSDFTPEPGWTTVVAGPMIAHLKVLRSDEDAETLRRRIMAHIAAERQSELADIRIVRGRSDFDPAMLPFVTAFLEHRLALGAPDPAALAKPPASA